MSVSLFPDPHISFQLATQQDIPAILTLIEKVRANLNDAEQHFLKDKSASEIGAYIDSEFPTVLAFKNGLLAGVAISTPQDPSKGLGASNLPDAFNRGHFMCIGTVAVDPAFHGQGIGAQVVKRAFEESSHFIAAQDGTNLCGVIAKVSAANTGSQKTFLANEFKQGFGTHTDSQGGYQFNVFSRGIEDLKLVTSADTSNVGEREKRIAERRARIGTPFLSRG